MNSYEFVEEFQARTGVTLSPNNQRILKSLLIEHLRAVASTTNFREHELLSCTPAKVMFFAKKKWGDNSGNYNTVRYVVEDSKLAGEVLTFDSGAKLVRNLAGWRICGYAPGGSDVFEALLEWKSIMVDET